MNEQPEADQEKGTKPSIAPKWWLYLGATYGYLSFVLGLGGLADGVVEWRDYALPMVELYTGLRDWVLALLPFRVPRWLADYLLLGSGLAISLNLNVNQEALGVRADERFYLSDRLILLFWILLIWALWPLYIVYLVYGWSRLRNTPADLTRVKRLYMYLLTVYATAIFALFLAVDFRETFAAA